MRRARTSTQEAVTDREGEKRERVWSLREVLCDREGREKESSVT
ncbi:MULTISPECIES: hypothetical protein [unclassified Bacillus (in: firmicutes)]|nr:MULTISPECIES: hypothetical protein [unclassified Bacillus (in: firmicutes)]